ncbi:MAG TPA: DUF3341 domain-containing protein [bacterium]|nr:DUF3341 domain-containing protein [bacterium]HQG45334.1 DUF3341 domain-containing protein [bacterium]HQI49572.1 DUF3341 domain-containing protein [bacterium]HQJ64762.1 DUF3341 domain-containing protein [bacterium]
MSRERSSQGMLAQYAGPDELLAAARQVAETGYHLFDCHSPFPIHGMDEAMRLRRSPLGYWVGAAAFTGATLAVLLQGWTSAIDYPLIISGKPFFSYQAFMPVTFGLAVLLGAFTAVFGMLALIKLPQYYHAVFHSDRFAQVTTDGFFISIEAADPLFDPEKTRTLLLATRAFRVEELLEKT